MKNLNPYINFSGKCREALNFYKECLNGEIETLSTFAEAPGETDEKFKDNVMHSEFRAGASTSWLPTACPVKTPLPAIISC